MRVSVAYNMDLPMTEKDDGGFSELKEKILYMLERHGDQLESLQKEVADIKITLALTAADSQLTKKTFSSFFGEVLKVVSAIVTAYALLRFGLA